MALWCVTVRRTLRGGVVLLWGAWLILPIFPNLFTICNKYDILHIKPSTCNGYGGGVVSPSGGGGVYPALLRKVGGRW